MQNDNLQTSAHSCGDHLELMTRTGSYSIHGTAIPVQEELYRCSVCGEEEYTYEQAQAIQKRADAAYRAQQRFLQPHEVAAMRKRWGVKQEQLERALGLGRKTVARWEGGRVLQNRSMDNLLRAIDTFPEVLVYLARLQGLELDIRSQWMETALESPGLKLPRFLMRQLEQAADEEGADVPVYAAALLAHGVERRATNRHVDRVEQKVDELTERLSEWNRERLVPEPEPEPIWLRDHRQNQHSSYAEAY